MIQKTVINTLPKGLQSWPDRTEEESVFGRGIFFPASDGSSSKVLQCRRKRTLHCVSLKSSSENLEDMAMTIIEAGNSLKEGHHVKWSSWEDGYLFLDSAGNVLRLAMVETIPYLPNVEELIGDKWVEVV